MTEGLSRNAADQVEILVDPSLDMACKCVVVPGKTRELHRLENA